MTPEVEDRCRGQGGDVGELIADIDSLRKGYTSIQEKYLTTFDELEILQEKYYSLVDAAKPFLTCSAKLIEIFADEETLFCLCVKAKDITNLRKALKGA